MLSVSETKEFLESFANYEKEINYTYTPESFNLKRVEIILSKLGNPHKQIKTIHIAGTKGKGSTAYIIASILKNAGYRVGLYTSPHIIYYTERINILEKDTGRLISDEEVAEIISIIKPLIAESGVRLSSAEVLVEKENEYEFRNLTYFEILTCVCFYFFAKEKVDYAVIEVGLGGRLDATNVITPLVSVITPISFDHTKELGETISAIAKEKAGIIKNNVPVVISKQTEEAKKVFRDITNEKKCNIYEFNKDFYVRIKETNNRESIFDFVSNNEKLENLHLSIIGEHQVFNSATAIETIKVLSDNNINIPNEIIYKTLQGLSFIGRLEVIQEEPTIILDGAHNEASAFYLKDSIKELFTYEKLFLVLGMSSNKDIKAFADVLCPVADEIVLTKANSPRAAEPDKLLETELAYYSDKIYCTQNVDEAVKYVLLRAGQRDLICFTGSFYILGEVKLFFADIDNY